MTLIHISRRKEDEVFDYWCPYCDRIVKFGKQNYYDEIWCMECKADFPPHTFPKGIDPRTGEII